MRLRNVVPLAIVAALMVIWLSTRMWCGNAYRVWVVSCVIGAWAPLAAAAVFLHVRAIGRDDDSVALAWLVRALGMHFVLAWMIGFSDWLAGPQGSDHVWNADLGAPLALVSFAPVFAISVLMQRWLVSLVSRLNEPMYRPAMPHESTRSDVVPFRGVPWVRIGVAAARMPRLPSAIALLAWPVIEAYGSVPWWVAPLCAIALAGTSVRNPRAIGYSVAALGIVCLAMLLRRQEISGSGPLWLCMVLPWLWLASVAMFLMATEVFAQIAAMRRGTRHAMRAPAHRR